MTVTITDIGSARVVEITGEQRGYGLGGVLQSRFEIHYSRETLEALLAAKGEAWLQDEVARAEEPAYVQELLRRQIERFMPIEGRRVLDFGCGCGASAICLARLGSASVDGVDPQADFVRAARLRARDSRRSPQGDGLAERSTPLAGIFDFHHVADTTRLPFADGQFDVVVMNAVLEHIPPRRRPAHLREVWRVVAPGGHLFLDETPNRFWPQDFHTTGLWWVPYLPLGLARRYAIARGRAPADVTRDRLVADGIRGGSYWEIARALGPGARCLNRVRGDDVAAFWARSLARSSKEGVPPGTSRGRMALKRCARVLHRLIDHALWRPLGIPAAAFLPALNLCFEKEADGRELNSRPSEE
jgi:SAM-dependent methyltransferase